MSQPRSLTVAIPTCNGERYIVEALKSILDQSEIDFELIVCDDRSTDQTLEAIRRFAGGRAQIEVNATRLGLAGNWNRCIELAQTPLVAIVHQDDVLRPGHLALHESILTANSRIGMSFSGALPIDGKGRPIDDGSIEPGWIGVSDQVFPPGEFLPELVDGNPIRCSAVVLRTETIRAVGGFDPAWRYVVDWECWARIARASAVSWVERNSAEFRWHAASETHRFSKGLADLTEEVRLVERIVGWVQAMDHLERTILAENHRHWRVRLCRAYLNRAYAAIKAGRPALARRASRLARKADPSLVESLWKDDPKLALGLLASDRAPELVRRLGQRPLSSPSLRGDNNVPRKP